jgi:hypothetical protein
VSDQRLQQLERVPAEDMHDASVAGSQQDGYTAFACRCVDMVVTVPPCVGPCKGEKVLAFRSFWEWRLRAVSVDVQKDASSGIHCLRRV